MKKRLLMILPVLALLASCSSGSSDGFKPGREYGDSNAYALYMNNIPRDTSTSESGNPEMVENTLYLKVDITDKLGQPLEKPNPDPIRENYDFMGWYKESKCENAWNFQTDIPYSSVILYAKWGVTHEEQPYTEPTYTPPERIIEDMDFKVTDILNKPLEEGKNEVNLTAGGINRLKKYSSDVKFAIGFGHRVGISLTNATFNSSTNQITATFSNNQSVTIKVNDITATLAVNNSYYETKAKNYEAKGEDIENYHIALGGSSSMENWDTSTEDMAPIVTFNHGIGGTTVEQWTNCLLERLFMPYSPKAVVYYVGVNNIINSGDKGTDCATKLEALFDKTHRYLPNAHIFYVLINKLPLYGHCQADFDIANNRALSYESAHDYLTCIDAGAGLLKPNGLPHFGYFRTDGLHMSRAGYAIWGAAVKEAVINWLDSTR